MKKIFNVLLILLACFLVNTNVFAADETDQNSCVAGRTYYNIFLFRSGEKPQYLSSFVGSHDDASRPYDFFADPTRTYNIECSGQVGIVSEDESGNRTQSIGNPSTCTGSVITNTQKGYSLPISGTESWTTTQYWTQFTKLTALEAGKNITLTNDSYDGWVANKYNYIYKIIGDEEIRIMISGSSKPITGKSENEYGVLVPNTLSGAWSKASNGPLDSWSVVSSPGDKSTLLPDTTMDLYFGRPTQWGVYPYHTYTPSENGKLSNKNGTSFKGINDVEKKFVVHRAGASPDRTKMALCNDTSICGDYTLFSPAIFVVKYTCSETKKCDPNQTCCYAEGSGNGTSGNNNGGFLTGGFLSLWRLLTGGGNNNGTSEANIGYDPTITQDSSDHYTYTKTGYWDGKEHSGPEGGGVLTKCKPTCNPLEECCYKKTNDGLIGAVNAFQNTGDALNDLLGRSNIVNLITGLNLVGNINDKVNDIIDNSIINIVGNVKAATLRYKYIEDKPTLITESVLLAGDESGDDDNRGTIQIKVPNVYDRYRAVIPYTDSNGKTNYKNIDLVKADSLSTADQNKLIMKSCGCDPEIECCYDSTGLNYNGTANMIKDSKKIVDGGEEVPLETKDIERIETYKLLETVKTNGLFTQMVTDLAQTGVDTFLDLITSYSVSDGINKVLSLDGLETTLLSAAKAVPESQARQMEGMATQFNVSDTIGWPPVVSGLTKHIYAKDLSAILQVKSCGCDEETECCYDEKGNYHYEYSGYNGFRWGTIDSHFHYQRIELSDNPYYNRTTYSKSGIAGSLTSELVTFIQNTTTPVVKCKAYHIDMNYACTRDDYQEISSGKYIEASPNRIERDSSGNVVRDYDDWYAQLSRGKATGVGYSILPESMKSLRYRGMDIVCADAYKITYPGIQDSGQKGQFVTIGNNNSYFTYNREFNNKTIDTRAPIAKIELKKTCVSTKALSTRTFNPTDILINQINFNVQHQFFKNYLQYSNLFGIDLDHNQTSDPNERKDIAQEITKFINRENIVKARLYYDDYDTAIKDGKGYIDLDLKAIKCPNIHKQFIEVQADEGSGELSLSDLGIYCSDESGNELTTADDSRSSPVYACSDTTTSDLQNEVGDSFYERMWAKCAAIPAAEDYADQGIEVGVGEKLEEFWYDFLNGFWTVKDYYYKTENIVLYASIPQIIVKGGTAITYMDKFENDTLGTNSIPKKSLLDDNSEYVVLPNNSIPIGFDTTSGIKNFRISVDINMGPTRKKPTLDMTKPTKVPQSTWDLWSKAATEVGGLDSYVAEEVASKRTVEDYSLQNSVKNDGLTDKANITSPLETKTVNSDGIIKHGETKEYVCSYKVDEDLGNANFFYRTISLSNINPQNRKLGTNWDYSNLASTKGPYGGLVQRINAYKALRLAGNDDDSEDNLFKKADNNYQTLTGSDKFTFKLSASTMRLIRRYNRVKMSVIAVNNETLNNNAAIGGNHRRGYADWSLGIVDYNGLSEQDNDGNTRRFDNSDGSTKWIIDFRDTSSSATTTVPDYVYRRYNSDDNNIGYHWYSPFLWCIYYGGSDYCNDIVSPVQSIKYKPEVKQDIKDVFSGYKTESNQSDEWDLRTNIQKLISKQNKLDNEAYKNVTNGEKLVKSEDPTKIYISMDHVPTMEEFGKLVFKYAETFRDVLSGANQSIFASEASTVLKRLLSSAGVNLSEGGNTVTDQTVSDVVSRMVQDVLGTLGRYN